MLAVLPYPPRPPPPAGRRPLEAESCPDDVPALCPRAVLPPTPSVSVLTGGLASAWSVRLLPAPPARRWRPGSQERLLWDLSASSCDTPILVTKIPQGVHDVLRWCHFPSLKLFQVPEDWGLWGFLKNNTQPSNRNLFEADWPLGPGRAARGCLKQVTRRHVWRLTLESKKEPWPVNAPG